MSINYYISKYFHWLNCTFILKVLSVIVHCTFISSKALHKFCFWFLLEIFEKKTVSKIFSPKYKHLIKKILWVFYKMKKDFWRIWKNKGKELKGNKTIFQRLKAKVLFWRGNITQINSFILFCNNLGTTKLTKTCSFRYFLYSLWVNEKIKLNLLVFKREAKHSKVAMQCLLLSSPMLYVDANQTKVAAEKMIEEK